MIFTLFLTCYQTARLAVKMNDCSLLRFLVWTLFSPVEAHVHVAAVGCVNLEVRLVSQSQIVPKKVLKKFSTPAYIRDLRFHYR